MMQLFDYGTLYGITVETKRNMLSQKVLILFRTVNMDLSEIEQTLIERNPRSDLTKLMLFTARYVTNIYHGQKQLMP
ncbi:hypothetical protein L1987_33395 [Smallanthus sonchifolius]|uniref:Uncharacterized protein n=1 Tax=Smallanthus sonchifolius TaxID=185202 RepID=A0ACB9HRL7_9ASTR|nr:hypothetical protein L1987_33395 [Smallanthus sonchifolius]